MMLQVGSADEAPPNMSHNIEVSDENLDAMEELSSNWKQHFLEKPSLQRQRIGTTIIKKVIRTITASHEPSYFREAARLQKLATQQRKYLQTSREFGFFFILFRYNSTAFPRVIMSFQFIFTICIYLGVRMAYVFGSTNIAPIASLNGLTAVGGLVAFWLIFFVNNMYNRFLTTYGHSKSVEGRISNIMICARQMLPPADAWRLMRYMNAFHMLAYVGLSCGYSYDNFLLPTNKKQQLLTPAELKRMQEIGLSGGACYREAIGWAISIITKNASRLTNNEKQYMITEILLARGAVNSIYDAEDLPVPLIFSHLMMFVLTCYLAQFAYCLAASITASVFGTELVVAMIVLLNTIVMLSMREIGNLFMHPYGLDKYNLCVVHFVNFTVLTSRRILLMQLITPFTTPDSDAKLESDLERKREIDIGHGFVSAGDMCSYSSSSV